MKLGSLFDGSGGFPLAGSLCGIDPVWASEVEPYPIAVTKSRFPNMKHLGSVTDVHGGDIEPVDIITFGSPCQDLSVAGKRAGLKHEANGDNETTRSGLFMEAVRIIKEMRKATNGEYPTFAVWENVPGAFSSNKGEDFRTVLEELIKIVEPSAVMPAVPKNGWPYADGYCGDGWSLAYRTYDAQYWGVPQRRRRIYLVLDLRGQRAGKVSFEREGLRGNFAESGTPWKAVAGDAADCAGTADKEKCYGIDGYNSAMDDVAATIGVNCGMSTGRNGVLILNSHSGNRMDGADAANHTGADGFEGECVAYAIDQQGGKGGANYAIEVIPTLCSDSHGTPHAVAYPIYIPYTMKIRSGCEGGGKGALIQEDKSGTLATNNDQYLFQPIAFAQNQRDEVRDLKDKAGALAAEPGMKQQTFVAVPCNLILDDQGGQQITVRTDGKVPTPRAETHGNIPCCLELTGDHENRITDYTTVICLQGNGIDRADTAGCNGKGWKEDTSYTLNTIDHPAVVYCTDIGFFNSQEEVAPTLLARQYKDPHLVSYPENAVQYIVRRITPTECARLQGFQDDWGHPDYKEDFTDEEYRFWMNVRNTHATINGKPQKDYTKDQILTWYNKLHTDSSEYKMWGNGISLPTALYVMQGIAEALKGGEGRRWQG